MLGGVDRRRRTRRRADPRPPAGLRRGLRREDLLDALGNIASPAVPHLSSPQLPRPLATHVDGDGLTGHLRHGHTAALRLMTQPGIQLIRELHGRPLHGMPAYHPSGAGGFPGHYPLPLVRGGLRREAACHGAAWGDREISTTSSTSSAVTTCGRTPTSFATSSSRSVGSRASTCRRSTRWLPPLRRRVLGQRTAGGTAGAGTRCGRLRLTAGRRLPCMAADFRVRP